MDLEILYYSVLVGVVVVLGSVAIISLARTATRNAFEMFKLAIIEAMTEILSPVIEQILRGVQRMRNYFRFVKQLCRPC